MTYTYKIIKNVALFFLLAIIMGAVISCSKEDEIVGYVAGYERAGYERICIDGVEYLFLSTQLAGHFKPDGSLFTCINQGK